MTGFRSTIDLSDVVARVNTGAEKAVLAGVEYLLGESNKHVPHDEGTLERSGEASASGTRGAVSYDTSYAVRQHEDMTLHHDGKGKAKWLENTMATERTTVGKIVQAKLAAELDQ